MWAWQSLDRQTFAWYSYTSTLAYSGYVSDVIAPDIYFGAAILHKTEEQAGARVAALYDEFVALQQKKGDHHEYGSSSTRRQVQCTDSRELVHRYHP